MSGASWSGTGTSNETTAELTIASLSSPVDATCAVTGSSSYAVTLNTDGGIINCGDVSSYNYGTITMLPTDVRKAGFVFGGWYGNEGLTGSAITSIGNTDVGAKTFYAKWTLKTPVAGSGNALSFDGTDDYVDVPENSAYTTNKFTVEAWIHYESNTTSNYYAGVISRGYDSNWSIMTYDVNQHGIIARMNGTELTSGFTDDNWHHVAMTYDESKFCLYIDGVLKNSADVTGYSPTDSPIVFGKRLEDVSRNYTGQLDEVKLWSTARTQAEIQADMYGHSTSESGLVGYWNFDEGSGGTASDSSATGADGTLTNMGISNACRSLTPPWLRASINGAISSVGTSGGVNTALKSSRPRRSKRESSRKSSTRTPKSPCGTRTETLLWRKKKLKSPCAYFTISSTPATL